MSDKILQFPIKRTTLEQIFQGLMEIGKVVENDQARKEIHSLTCHHCGKTF